MSDIATVKPRIGLMAVGLGAYWPQFPGMRDGVLGAHQRLARLFEGAGEIVAAGLVDSAAASRQAGELFARERVDIVFCHLTTYANSETLLSAVSAVDVPVILLNVQPVRALDFPNVVSTAGWLGVACTCAALPEMTAVLIRTGKRFATITGHLDGDAELERRIRLWCTVAGISRRLHTQSLALLGRPFPGMLDLHIDETRLYQRFGTLTNHLSWDDIIVEMKEVTPADRNSGADRVRAMFDYPPTVTAHDLDAIATTLCALRRTVEKHSLFGIATHFEGIPTGPVAELLAALNPALSVLITDGVACPVEGDLKAALAMVALKALAGNATLAELYSMDFNEDVCIIGHSGAGDAAISSRRPTLSASEVFHGKSGKGYLTQFFPKTGAATLLACTQDAGGDYRFVAAEGEIVEGPTLGLGDTNCRVRFSCGMRDFTERWSNLGPTHHGVIGMGKHIDSLKSVSTALGIPIDVVCR
jgi:L-arabinose isomerase